MSHLLLQNILQKEVQQETRRETRTSWSWLIPVLHFNDCRVKELLLLDALAPRDVPAAQIAFISVTLSVYFDTQQDRSKNTPTCPQKMPRLIIKMLYFECGMQIQDCNLTRAQQIIESTHSKTTSKFSFIHILKSCVAYVIPMRTRSLHTFSPSFCRFLTKFFFSAQAWLILYASGQLHDKSSTKTVLGEIYSRENSFFFPLMSGGL